MQLPDPPILTIFLDLCIRLKFKNALNTKLFPPPTCFSSCLLHNAFVILSPSSLRSLLDLHLNHPSSPSVTSQDHRRSFRYAAPQLWNKLPHLFCFISVGHTHSSPSFLCSDPKPVVHLSRDLFHFRLKTYLFSKSFLLFRGLIWRNIYQLVFGSLWRW